jgi:hypothetical protein
MSLPLPARYLVQGVGDRSKMCARLRLSVSLSPGVWSAHQYRTAATLSIESNDLHCYRFFARSAASFRVPHSRINSPDFPPE